MAQPEVRVLLSTQAAGLLGERVQGALPGRVVQLLRAEEQVPGSQADVAFVSAT
jgi:hypothetical protein